jgi:serine/threonine protein kinase
MIRISIRILIKTVSMQNTAGVCSLFFSKLGWLCRDVKPSNFLYDRVGRRYSLVDFGLAQYQKDICSNQTTGRGNKRKADDEHEPEAVTPNKKGRSLINGKSHSFGGLPLHRRSLERCFFSSSFWK